MKNNEKHEITGNVYHLTVILDAALRFGLEHNPYLSEIIPGVISDNIDLLCENTFVCLLKYLDNYEKAQKEKSIYESHCACKNWKGLKETLKREFITRFGDRVKQYGFHNEHEYLKDEGAGDEA